MKSVLKLNYVENIANLFEKMKLQNGTATNEGRVISVEIVEGKTKF